MPHLILPIEAGGPIVIVYIAPSAPRQQLGGMASHASRFTYHARNSLVRAGIVQ